MNYKICHNYKLAGRPLQVGLEKTDRGGVAGTKKSQTANKRLIECSHCSFTTNHEYSLLRHMRKHTGEKPYSCPHCSYRCRESCRLKLHLRTHTGEKPFSCPYCSYQAADNRNLKRHIASHGNKGDLLLEEDPLYISGS